MKKGNWVVGSIVKKTNVFIMSTTAFQHLSEDSACTEAARLAIIHTDRKFVVLKVTGIVAAETIVWE